MVSAAIVNERVPFMADIIDISQRLEPGMTGFPGDTVYQEGWTFRIGSGCPVNVARLSLSVHCGSHADAPLHYAAAGAAVGELALSDFIGACRVIDARGTGALCMPGDLAGRLDGVPPRVLLRLAEHGDHRQWPAGFRAVAPETVAVLAAHGVRLIGVDVPSVDPETSKALPAHKMVLQHDMRILENLTLSHVSPGDYELIALPLRLMNLDASPVRAVLRPLQKPMGAMGSA